MSCVLGAVKHCMCMCVCMEETDKLKLITDAVY